MGESSQRVRRAYADDAPDQHSDWRHAPRGAMVFYDTSSNGHVALSLGDGRVVSSSDHGHVGIVPVDRFRQPLGWAYAPY
jgi:cell wall-associated NlpC family hydrolase